MITKLSLTTPVFATIAASIALGWAAGSADARPSTKSFTCIGVQDYIDARGAVVMNHKRSDLYRRFVAHSGYCRNEGGATKIFVVPTKTGSCRLRICTERRRFKFFGDD